MTEITTTNKEPTGFIDNLTDFFSNAIDKTDESAAQTRVDELRQAHPEADIDTLVAMLVKKKTMQTAGVGAATAAMASLPGLGTAATLMFGVPLDIGLTFKWQAELVLEIAVVHNHILTHEEKRQAVLLVTGLSAGAAQLAKSAGRRVGQKITENASRKVATKAIPVVGAVFSGGTNALVTQVIGRRAHAYFSLGPEAMEDWADSVRAVTGIDERKLFASVSSGVETAWQATSARLKQGAGAIGDGGKLIAGRMKRSPKVIEGELA